MDRHRQVHARRSARAGRLPLEPLRGAELLRHRGPRSAIDGRRRESCRSISASAASCSRGRTVPPAIESTQRLSIGPLWQMTDRDRAAAEPRPRGRDYRNPIAGFTRHAASRYAAQRADRARLAAAAAMCPSTPACSATGRHRPTRRSRSRATPATLAASLTFDDPLRHSLTTPSRITLQPSPLVHRSY